MRNQERLGEAECTRVSQPPVLRAGTMATELGRRLNGGAKETQNAGDIWVFRLSTLLMAP